jgi:hypothetical protein
MRNGSVVTGLVDQATGNTGEKEVDRILTIG